MTAKRKAIVDGPLRIRLTLDRGLAAYVRAHVKGIGIAGSERETLVFMIRDCIVRDCENQVLCHLMMPHLPPDIRAAWGHK